MVGRILVHVTEEDKNYIKLLSEFFRGKANVSVTNERFDLWHSAKMSLDKKGSKRLVSTSEEFLRILTKNPKASLDAYAGSIFNFPEGYEVLFVDPLKRLHTVRYARHLLKRYLDKFLKPETWMRLPEFKWLLFSSKFADEILEFFLGCDLISADIECSRETKEIYCIGFTGVKILEGRLSQLTTVVPFFSEYELAFVRTVLDLEIPKVFQNGKFDIFHLFRYNSPPTAYYFDTLNMMHSWYCEYPKDLAFVISFTLREWKYHKSESNTSNLMQYFEYNAKDSFSTAFAFISMLIEVPEYALTNYVLEFSVVPPCILSEHTGIKIDADQMEVVKGEVNRIVEEELSKLRAMVGNKNYNPGSPLQTQKLFSALGCGDIKGTGEKQRDVVSFRHPLNEILMKGIETYRKARKLGGSYVKDTVSYRGRCFYALNPHGTDTSRLASNESAMDFGLQIQNIPREGEGPSVKSMFVADHGYLLGEADNEQAESRTTGYISGEPGLIAAVEGPFDFHGLNASKFFGLPYESIVDPETKKTKDKPIRDLSKRTNHGANYNMGPQVMLETMGIKNVIRARRLLGLPASMRPIKVCEYLLMCFDRAYPGIRGGYYNAVKQQVAATRLLVGATGFTRFCFGNPSGNKPDLNAYVAHGPQSLNAQILNKAYINVFNNVWRRNKRDFKLCAQIHDSILFQYREGFQHLALEVKKNMEIPTQVKDVYGVSRRMLIPVSVKHGKKLWSQL